MNSKGFIYILKNPSFKDYVKIGYADNVEERVKQLNSSECTPFAFRIYATYEVNSRLMDKKVHSIIDKLNPTLRSIDEVNGQKRIREFYAMSAEDAYSIFEAMAEINDCPEKLKKWELSEENIREEKIAEEIEEKAKRTRCANYTFDYWEIPEGAVLVNINNPEIQCTVVDKKNVTYKGEVISMTRLAKIVSGNEGLSHGPGYVARNFTYNGELITNIKAL